MISSLLKRNIRSIIATSATRHRMPHPSVFDFSSFDAEDTKQHEEIVDKEWIDRTFASYFGLCGKGHNFHNNQVFEITAFKEMAVKLQRSMHSGHGGVALAKLQTVRNELLDVPQGREVCVVFVQNGRASHFEKFLPKELRDELPEEPQRPASIRSKIPSYPFPNTRYSLFDAPHFWSPLSTNLLFEQSAWRIYHNKAAFEAAKRFADEQGDCAMSPEEEALLQDGVNSTDETSKWAGLKESIQHMIWYASVAWDMAAAVGQ
eukprot:gnl/TRDRNA2_/TRDRNA2_175479_c0_seq11.p1 gnl/TRDRNA2_/TRDRNA2_175479_c0~~gnl/TRDRNA2_/TRDRNA2_175479_c0_seq11.p1  ORF type:complete len:262 (-),score=27.38 gnl/TRDRNA2_/TRDRNA2_175479_c0_seq11:369-1154(-)